ncbi:hypothetical protein [Rhizobium leguminosarum]|uniref:hypothetical protein n=1 Tax=Rhizobium leguminosarum TaxID=384 RepID=UPI0013AEE58D|nr:hypothetical protein [Rhizobium leguminosarum]
MGRKHHQDLHLCIPSLFDRSQNRLRESKYVKFSTSPQLHVGIGHTLVLVALCAACIHGNLVLFPAQHGRRNGMAIEDQMFSRRFAGLLSAAFQLLTRLSGFSNGKTATRRRHSQLFYRLSPKISL